MFAGWLVLCYFLDEKWVLAVGTGLALLYLHQIRTEAALAAMNIRVTAEATYYQLKRPEYAE
jgi:hypothetical protein